MPDEERVDPIDITPRSGEEPPVSGRQRWPQQRLVLTILAVLVAFALGRVTAPAPAPTSQQPAGTAADVMATGRQCSVQNGKTLQVGIEIGNQGPSTVTVHSLQASAPLGGLSLRGVGWGACGQLGVVPMGAAAAGQPTRLIPAGGFDWIWALYDVTEACPAPYPVRFLIDPVTSADLVDVGGFNDLGDVPYTGCT
ncbi:hypothetical protein GCM10009682_52190 [Luedemannella flava]|uniref:Uncharacterized protein n=1 Tax=Luedemannella flava TaxID=349316 RepID=A0ABP4YPL5_9ACTN